MREPREVAAMLALHAKGWGPKRIARELGVSRNTVNRYLGAGGLVAYRSPKRDARLAVWGRAPSGHAPYRLCLQQLDQVALRRHQK